MPFIHYCLGKLILFFDWLTTPKGITRCMEQQAKIDEHARALTLYQYEACPFCVKVRRAMKRQSLNIQKLDAKRNPIAREQLITGGGKLKVPCLKIEEEAGETSWMYESKEIIAYLEQRFSTI